VATKLFTYPGPYQGIEERENYQTERHASISVNVDYARGYIEPRLGFTHLANTGLDTGKIHVCEPRNLPPRILMMGKKSGKVQFQTADLDGNLTTMQDVSTDLGEPFDPSEDPTEFECSFIDCTLPTFDENGNVQDTHFITVVSTKYTTYVYDAVRDSANLRAVDMTQDVDQLGKLNVSYWDGAPRGTIAVRHNSLYFYAGFRLYDKVDFTDTLEEKQNLVPKWRLDEARSIFTLDPALVMHSDLWKFADIKADNMFFVDERERITGLVSFKGMLVAFTDRAIYNLHGQSADTRTISKAVDGVGCVAPDSVIAVGGLIYFLSYDGVYSYAGQATEGAVKKISSGVDSMFTHRAAETHLPFEVKTNLRALGYPFYVDRNLLRHAKALHIKSRQQIWWSLPVGTGAIASSDFSTTLVWDYRNQAWTVFTGEYGGGAFNHKFFSGDTITVGAEERVYTLSSTGKLYRYGMELRDYNGTNYKSPEMVWQSSRMFRTSDSVSTYRPLRFKILTRGKTPTASSNRPRWFMEGEEQATDSKMIEGASTVRRVLTADRQATSGDFDFHPNEDSNNFYNSSGGGVYGEDDTDAVADYEGSSWMTFKAEPGAVKSRSFRVGVLDPAKTTLGPYLVIRDYSVETDAGDFR